MLASFIAQMNEQLERLADSGLPAEARAHLHARIVQSRQVAEGIRLHGADDFVASLDAVVGAAFQHADQKQPQQKSWLEGLGKVIDLGLKMITLAEKGRDYLPAMGRKLLGAAASIP
jgi:hypothetical protein